MSTMPRNYAPAQERRPIPGYRGLVDCVGNVYYINSHGKPLRAHATKQDGRSFVALFAREGKERHKLWVDQLVAEAFLPPKPEHHVLHHLNGKLHDSRYNNLAWIPLAADNIPPFEPDDVRIVLEADDERPEVYY